MFNYNKYKFSQFFFTFIHLLCIFSLVLFIRFHLIYINSIAVMFTPLICVHLYIYIHIYTYTYIYIYTCLHSVISCSYSVTLFISRSSDLNGVLSGFLGCFSASNRHSFPNISRKNNFTICETVHSIKKDLWYSHFSQRSRRLNFEM